MIAKILFFSLMEVPITLGADLNAIYLDLILNKEVVCHL